MAAEVEPFCEQGLVNALGGCCGSRPEHIAAIVKMAANYPPRAKHGVGGCCLRSPLRLGTSEQWCTCSKTRALIIGLSLQHRCFSIMLMTASERFVFLQVEPLMRLSGLEPLLYRPDLENQRSTFLSIGERCNVAGSMIYKKAIVDGDYDKAQGIALKQVGPH